METPWTQLHPAEDPPAPCEKFEANLFAEGRCQHCFRGLKYHQPGPGLEQLPPETFDDNVLVEHSYYDVVFTSETSDPTNPLCILAPECELFICDRNEQEERWPELLDPLDYSLVLTAEESWEHGAPQDSTPFQGMILLSETERDDDMWPPGQQVEVRTRLQNGGSKWGSNNSTALSSRRGSTLKEESSPGRNAREEWSKTRVESGYFSPERRKSESDRSSSPALQGDERGPGQRHSPLRRDSVGSSLALSKRLTSSASSLDSESSWGTAAAMSDPQQIRGRQDYSILADIPKPKRISNTEAFEMERRQMKLKMRHRSPGRVEVERLFGQDRRKSDVLEAFEALESGMLERLEGKFLQSLERRVTRRQSSPTLSREATSPGQQELMSRRASLRPASDKPKEKSSNGTEVDWRKREGVPKSAGRSEKVEADGPSSRRSVRSFSTTADHSRSLTTGQSLSKTSDQHLSRTTGHSLSRTLAQTSSKTSDRSTFRVSDQSLSWTAGRTASRTSDQPLSRETGRLVSRSSNQTSSVIHGESVSRTFDRPSSRVSDRMPSKTPEQPLSKIIGQSLKRTSNQSLSRVSDHSPSRTSEQLFSRTTDQTLSKSSDRSPSRSSDRSSTKFPDQPIFRTTGRPLTRASDRSSSRVSDHSPSRIFDRSPSRISDRSPTRVSDRSTSKISDRSAPKLSELSSSRNSDQPLFKSTGRAFDCSPSRVSDRSPSRVSDLSPSRQSDQTRSKVSGWSQSRVSDQPPSRTSAQPLFGTTGRSLSKASDMSPSRTSDRSPTRVKDQPPPRVTDHSPSRVSNSYTSKVSDQSSSRISEHTPSRTNDPAFCRATARSLSRTFDHSTSRESSRSPSRVRVSDRSPSRVSDWSPATVSDRSPTRVSDQSPAKVSDRSLARVCDRVPSRVLESYPSRVSDQSPSRVSDRSPSRVSDRSPSRVSDRSPSRVSEQSPSRTSDQPLLRPTVRSLSRTSDQSPSRMSDWSPARTSHQPPSKISDQSSSTVSVQSQFTRIGRSLSRTTNQSASKTHDRSTARLSDVQPSLVPISGQYQTFLAEQLQGHHSEDRDRHLSQHTEKQHSQPSDASLSKLSSGELHQSLKRPASQQSVYEDTARYPVTKENNGKPDLLNFKKGWMSLLDEQGEFKKHWFVLTDTSLRYYRDSNAEETDDLDGEIDLRACTEVPEFAVQRNYGFQIHIQSLRAQLDRSRREVESYRASSERRNTQGKAQSAAGGKVPRGFISQESCERSLAEMENSHHQAMEELQRHHQRELERLHREKDEELAEETAMTAAAIEAMRKAHQEDLQRELSKARNFQSSGSGVAGQETLRRQYQLEVESLRRELQVLSERYSQKCLEIESLTQSVVDRERALQRCQQEGKELVRQNQELNSRLSEEIGKLRTFMATHSDGGIQNDERNSCELEVLLRVKENELQYLKKEVNCLRDDLHNLQKDKRVASEKYNDIYVELNNIKSRSEREIEQLKEHLRLAMVALQEEAAISNSIGD
ncbi:TRIO and F-actin-binding protein isoform X3 [Ambystoma mexicanum]|uniref:TRIO and F-actin-binding protein isoform X3 n=1 Tax=Ambystoma mexicanum TaxID=8296 RepID=UPI0037E8421E